MPKPSIRGRILRRQLMTFKKILDDAKRVGENDVFLALCRFRIAETEAAIERENSRRAA